MAAGNAWRRDARWCVTLSSVVVLGLGLYFRCAHVGAMPLGPGEGLRSLGALAVVEAPHPPLYWVLLRMWAGLAGESAAGLRAFSVLAGVLAIPLGYGLVEMLGGSRRAAWLAAALIAVSPIQVLESKQARPEALGTLVTVGSCLALARALRRNRRRDWAWYDLAVVAGMYTQILFLPVLAAQGIWVTVWTAGSSARSFRSSPERIRYWKAAAGGILAFLPWGVVMAFRGWKEALAAAGVGAPWSQGIAHFHVAAYLAASFVVAWLLARECESPAVLWRRVSQGAAAVVLLSGVAAIAASSLAIR